LSLALLVVILWAAWLRHSFPGYLGTTQLLINAMSVLIAVIPEGLPVSVTLSLTVIAKAMGKSKVLCKSLATVETLGAVNVLCSDKTGTLTQNKMFVQNAAILDEEYSTNQARSAIIKGNPGERESLEQLHVVAGLCNGAQFDAATLTLPIAERRINGDATDTAILRFAEELGEVNDLTGNWKREFDLPFNSKNKYMVWLSNWLSNFRFDCLESKQERKTTHTSKPLSDRLGIRLMMTICFF
jgi:sodium/potassium-transporting ATPase subunit alpha